MVKQSNIELEQKLIDKQIRILKDIRTTIETESVEFKFSLLHMLGTDILTIAAGFILDEKRRQEYLNEIQKEISLLRNELQEKGKTWLQ